MFVHDDDYFEHPVRMQADLLTREKYQQRIFDGNLVKSRLSLSNENRVQMNPIAKAACNNTDDATLNEPGYLLLKRELSKLNYIEKRTNPDGSSIIKEVVDGAAKEYRFENHNTRCYRCSESIANDIQCRHELKNSGEFNIDHWNRRYHFHSYLELSPRNNGGNDICRSVTEKDDNISSATMDTSQGVYLGIAQEGSNVNPKEPDNHNSVYVSSKSHNAEIEFRDLEALASSLASRVSNAPTMVKEQVAGLLYEVSKLATETARG